jgi:hypothetical protein
MTSAYSIDKTSVPFPSTWLYKLEADVLRKPSQPETLNPEEFVYELRVHAPNCGIIVAAKRVNL